MIKHLMIALALVALAQSVAHTADRATIAKQVAEKCRKDWPTDYPIQLVCREAQMEAFDKLEQQDHELATPHNTPEEPRPRQENLHPR